MFLLGLFLTFFWMKGAPGPRDYVVKAGDKLELSWYLQTGDRTEGCFTVRGGSREARFVIVDPSGKVIYSADVKNRHDHGFTASDSGVYSFTFQNLDESNDESIYVRFRSPYEPRLTVYDGVELLTMLGGIALLLFSEHALHKAKNNSETPVSSST